MTLITDVSHQVEGRVDGERFLVEPAAFERATGWTLKAEGICGEGTCVPVADPDALYSAGCLDFGAVSEALGRQVVVDAGPGIAAMALSHEGRRRVLEDLEAAPFSLPDLDGVEHALDEWKGSKKLLVTFSSWCGCRYDLPGWQALHDELAPEGFTALAVAIDHEAKDVEPWVEEISFPVLLDSNHVLTELYAISNVPTVLWIDEENRIVRPNGLAFGTDTFKDFTGVDAAPHLDAVRRWVREGAVPMAESEAKGAVADLSADEVLARLHFRVAAEALRQGHQEVAGRHFEEATALAPYDWTIRRAAMPLTGRDPFGGEFLALYEEWQTVGRPYHGLAAMAD